MYCGHHLPEQAQVEQWRPAPHESQRAQCEHDAQHREQGQHIGCEYALLKESNRIRQSEIGIAHSVRERQVNLQVANNNKKNIVIKCMCLRNRKLNKHSHFLIDAYMNIMPNKI